MKAMGKKMPAKKTAAKKSSVMQKSTGESYASKAMMKRHEAKEPMGAMSREYGKKMAMKKMAARKKK